MKWLYDNKEWIFSGIGVVILSGIAGLLLRYFSNRTKAGTERGNPSASQLPIATARSEIRHEDMMVDIENRPPYQRKDAENHYIGVRISFHGTFFNLYKMNEQDVRITLRHPDKMYRAVKFNVRIADYPIFKVMKEGTPVRVHGKIISFEGSDPVLQDITIE